MAGLLDQIKNRRKELGLTQADMEMRVGMSRQQYQRLESRGNPRLDSLELLAKGLKLELMLIPHEKLRMVQAVLEGRPVGGTASLLAEPGPTESDLLRTGNPWPDLLGDDE